MFKLLKLAFYVLVGYALYELYLGFSAEGGGESQPRRAARGGQRQRHGNISGPGEGRRVKTGETGGTSAPHRVGRGVV